MATDVIMPQMGESIFEGTITKWLKKTGERVQRDEPLFEISTDKVDAEIPAPASGVLKEIKAAEGTTVQVNTVVAVIDESGAVAATASAPAVAAAPTPAPAKTEAPAPAAEAAEEDEAEGESGDRVRSSPLVRKLARQHNIDLHGVPGTGMSGRVTKEDILSFIEQHPTGAAAPVAVPAAPAPAAAAAPAPAPPATGGVTVPGDLVPMTPMRKKIAERMVESKHTSAHVHTVFEVDMTRIVALRAKLKGDFERRTGTKMTVMPFFCRAAIHGIRKFPILNSSIEGDNIRYHRTVNLGIAVSLDWGLIVPVIKNSEEKNFLGLQRTLTDLADRARARKLVPDEVAGGTFTITNPGNYGQMFGLPIIVQPQVAILGVGNIKKQPVVVTDANGQDSIAIRSICHVALGYDHRVIDGAVADQFLREVALFLQNWNEDVG